LMDIMKTNTNLILQLTSHPFYVHERKKHEYVTTTNTTNTTSLRSAESNNIAFCKPITLPIQFITT
jgi:hypothetical protein